MGIVNEGMEFLSAKDDGKEKTFRQSSFMTPNGGLYARSPEKTGKLFCQLVPL